MIAVVAAALCAAVLGYLLVTLLVRRSAVDRTIAQLDRAGIDADRKAELGVFARFFDDRGSGKLERRLIQAGWYTTTAGSFLMRPFFCTIAGAAVGIAVPFVLQRHEPII